MSWPAPAALRPRGDTDRPLLGSLRLWQQVLLFAGLAVSLTAAGVLWLAARRFEQAAVAQATVQLDRAASAIELLARSRFERRRASLLDWAGAALPLPAQSSSARPGSTGAVGDRRFAFVVSAGGEVTRAAGDLPLPPEELSSIRPVVAARGGEDGAGLWKLDGRLFEVLTLSLGAPGVAVLGEELGDVVAQVQAVTGGEVLLLADDQVVESTLSRRLVEPLRSQLAAAGGSTTRRLVTLGGTRYLLGLHDVPTDFGGGVCRHVVLQSLPEVIAPSRRAALEIALLTLGALAVVLATATMASRAVTRPLSRLTAAVKGMAARARLETDFPSSGGGYEVEILEGAFRRLAASVRRAEGDRLLSYRQSIGAVVAAIEARDHGTHGHSLRVADYAVLLARRAGVGEERLSGIEWGAMLHDVGKIAVPDAVLRKPGRLDPAEWEIMRRHPRWGVEILSRVAFLRPALPVVASHHERWDGRGYPLGLAGEQIPFEARLFAVVDTYDAITSPRPYRLSRTHQEAVEELRRVAGAQLDPSLVETFCALPQAVLAAVQRRHDESAPDDDQLVLAAG